MALPEALKGDKWSASVARKILPLLVSYAEACRRITYGQLSKEVVRRKWGHRVMPLAYRKPAGAIGFALEETANKKEWRKIPPINALIVNASSGLPGEGVDYFLRTYLRHIKQKKRLTKSQRQSVVEEIHKDVFNYTDWRKLLEYYGLNSPPEIGKRPRKKIAKRKKYNWGGEAESEAHKKLKMYVSEHPELLQLPRNTAPGETEYILPSADKIDVLFLTGSWRIAVEVKSSTSNDDDLRRGVFQCVKYRELLRAEQRTDGILPHARSILVTERSLPKKISREAELLKVPCITIALTRRSA